MRPRFETPGAPAIQVLIITSEWPGPGAELSGLYVAQQVKYLREAGVEVEVFAFRGRKNPMNYLRAWSAVQNRLSEGKHDLVHAHFGQSGLLALPKRRPLVVTLHGTDASGIAFDAVPKWTDLTRILSWISRRVATRADAVIVVSQHMKKYLRQVDSIEVIPCGVNFELFREMPRTEARAQLGLPADEHLVLFAGNPDCFGKRCHLAKQAVELVNRTTPARLIVAWGVPHQQMPLYMNACDAILMTSIDEGSPCVIKEALACNLPVVSVQVGDVAERIADVAGCRLCRDDRPETIAADLGIVLRRNQRVHGREAVRSLDERILMQQMVGIYQRVLGRQASSRGETVEVATTR